MYARYTKIVFKDKLSKEMAIKYTNTTSDTDGIKNGLLLKLMFDISDNTMGALLLFPDYETCQKDYKNVAEPILESFKTQGLKVDTVEGPIGGSIAVNMDFIDHLKKTGTFYNSNN